jgi:hypothetical protein
MKADRAWETTYPVQLFSGNPVFHEEKFLHSVFVTHPIPHQYLIETLLFQNR